MSRPVRFRPEAETEVLEATSGMSGAGADSVKSSTLSEAPDSVKDNPQQAPAGRCRPGLSVPNLDEFHKRMVERNVPCIQEPKAIFGTRVAQYLDPDGLAISVGEERRGS